MASFIANNKHKDNIKSRHTLGKAEPIGPNVLVVLANTLGLKKDKGAGYFNNKSHGKWDYFL